MPKTVYDDPDDQILFIWANMKLAQVEVAPIMDVASGFETGCNLASVIHACTGVKLHVKSNPKILAAKTDNVRVCFDCLEQAGISTKGYSPMDFQEGNQKMIFGILFKIMVTLDPHDEAKIFQWVKEVVSDQLEDIDIQLESFKDGRVLAAMVNSVQPGCIDLASLDMVDESANLDVAFAKIEEVFGVEAAFSAEEMNQERLLVYLGLIKGNYKKTKESRAATTTATAPPPTGASDTSMFDGIQVTVVSAMNLTNMESFGKMSPYTQVWVNFEPHEKNTSVHERGGVAPEWNETVSWQARGKIEKLRMKVIVWDKEDFGFDDYVGGADVGVHTMVKGESIEKWVPIQQHTQAAGSVLLKIELK